MPTGYTAAVQDGSITTLRDYALLCARGFGAFLPMRDAPADAPLTLPPPADTAYYDQRIAEAERILALPLADLQTMAADQNAEALRRHNEREAARALHETRYRAVLYQVRAWVKPSEDFANFKAFMVEQLEQSIEFDCLPGASVNAPRGDITPESILESARADLEHCTQQRNAEIARAADRRRWAVALMESLDVA